MVRGLLGLGEGRRILSSFCFLPTPQPSLVGLLRIDLNLDKKVLELTYPLKKKKEIVIL